MQALSIDQLVGQTLGNYHIERFLGKGRLNAIYLARNLASLRLDALVMYLVPSNFSVEANARFLTRFYKESASITRLDHPHILPVYEYGEYAGTPYLVTPYVTQGSLADLLKQYGRYDHTAVIPVLEQIAAGIIYAHGQGYIHGTLRPSNIVIRDQEILQVAGFGLMHMLQLGGIERSDLPYAHLLSVGQTFLAAPEYIAPEVVQGQVVDIRSDVYALGCILFELLCGRPPFTGSDPFEVARQHVTQELPPLRALRPDIPFVLVSVVNQALERDPGRRFQYVEELMEAFVQASRGASSAPAVQRPSYLEEPQNWLQRTQAPEPIQEASPARYGMSNTNKWQLLPPIVTGKLPKLPRTSAPLPTLGARVSQQLNESQSTGITLPPLPPVPVADSPTLPPAGAMLRSYTTKPLSSVSAPVANSPTLPSAGAAPRSYTTKPLSSVSAPVADGPMLPLSGPVRRSYATKPLFGIDAPVYAPPQSVPMTAREESKGSFPTSGNNQMVPTLPDPAVNSLPGVYQDTDQLAQSYSWWSDPGIAEESEEGKKPFPSVEKREEPVQNVPSAQMPSMREPLLVPGSGGWMSEPVIPPDVRRDFGSSTKKGRKGGRRAVVALLAVGVVAAGVGGGAATGVLKLDPLQRLLGLIHQPSAAPQQVKNSNVSTQPTQPPPNPAHNNNTTPQPTGNSIGNTNQAVNSAVVFTNPASGMPALLIRLANGNFVAYDRACTHVGVLVNYDPATKMLVCPAHGAIFDPANNGAVVEGPGGGSVQISPLPKITVQVQATGTITTG